jgi:hypothetical protein
MPSGVGPKKALLKEHENTMRNRRRYNHHVAYHTKRGHTDPGSRANADAMMEATAARMDEKDKARSHKHTFRSSSAMQGGRRTRRHRRRHHIRRR